MVCELQYINWTILFRKSNTTHRIHVNRERNYQGEGIPVSYTHLIHIHAHMIDDHAEDPECADTRQRVIMNTVHLSLFPPHEISHAHTLTRWLTEEHNWVQIVWGIHGGGMWFCSGGVWDENSIVTGGRLFLQGTEGVLHVLHQLCILGLDLGFTILNRVLHGNKQE